MHLAMKSDSDFNVFGIAWDKAGSRNLKLQAIARSPTCILKLVCDSVSQSLIEYKTVEGEAITANSAWKQQVIMDSFADIGKPVREPASRKQAILTQLDGDLVELGCFIDPRSFARFLSHSAFSFTRCFIHPRWGARWSH